LVLALGSALPDSLAYHSPLKEASIQRVPIETPEEDVAVRFVTLPSAQITPTMAYTSYLPIVIKPEPPPQPTDCDLYEPNDTSEQANTIQPGEMRTDCVLPETDIDWWVFLVTTEAEVIIEVLGDGGSGDLYVKLYDNNLNLIESDIGFGGTDAQIDRLCGTGQDPLSAGTYYVSVEDYLNNDEIIPYDISLVVAPCPSAVVLANHSSYITLDSSPSLIVVGEIQNNGVIGMRDIRLVVNLFNNSGQLIDTTVAYNFRWLDSALGPGDKTCFQAEFSEFDGWSYYEFETPTYTSIGDPLQNMTVYGDNGTYDPGDGSYRILGFIRNDNDSQVTDVDLIATLYDTVNTTVGCGFTPTNNDDLNPGQSSSFELTFSGYYRDYADVDSYRLQVDGFLQEP
ncbi:MAG: hypothetical protein GWN13_03025, partial [Phycisphaerae bacterium]|nr:hypothetical protein [Phycisphaerae bacterium]